MTTLAAALDSALSRSRVLDFVSLTKPGLLSMAVLTAALGFCWGSPAPVHYPTLLLTLVGTALAGGGALALNQYFERESDARMERTRSRPLPDGRLEPGAARTFGFVLAASGVLWLGLFAGVLPAFLAAASVGSYLWVYTPLKRRSALCTLAGAVPGALPPLIGWAAARGTLGAGAWFLFGVLFLWQIPHSLAIAWLYREDYARAGLRVLPSVDPEGTLTVRQILLHSVALAVLALAPGAVGAAGAVYTGAALLLGGTLVGAGVRLARSRSRNAARHVLWVTLVYLPLLLAALVADRGLGMP
ncbi:MAG: hypothetical protein KatS3mg076_0334 [Candidatus Binatia bacterium]|nr:MAG: hypothetical protein KatS3mg076_0334 [Candidatus Binatia bacterium]